MSLRYVRTGGCSAPANSAANWPPLRANASPPPTAVVLVDFDGVEVASSPVLDEIACALRAAITDNPGRSVVLTNLNEDVHDTLRLVVEQRDMTLAMLKDDELQLIGGRQHLEETLRGARELGRFTAAQLADRLELKLPNLHQRLGQLQAAGAVTRVEPAAGRSGRWCSRPQTSPSWLRPSGSGLARGAHGGRPDPC